jgi:protein TonB
MNPATTPSFTMLDRTAGRRMSPQSVGIAVFCNAAVLLLLLQQVHKTGVFPIPIKPIFFAPTLPPPPMPPSHDAAAGGGGNTGVAPPAQGNLPKFATEQLDPPKIPVDSKIRIDSTVDVKNLQMATVNLPNIGMPNSPLVGSSLGSKGKSGIGIGDGPGIGPNDGLHTIGIGGVSAPVVLFAPEPQFSDEARQKKVSGNVLVYLQVDANGRPTHIRILRGIGMGLDEKAIEAVSQYKFKPAIQNGHPVAVEMNVNVDFNIY